MVLSFDNFWLKQIIELREDIASLGLSNHKYYIYLERYGNSFFELNSLKEIEEVESLLDEKWDKKDIQVFIFPVKDEEYNYGYLIASVNNLEECQKSALQVLIRNWAKLLTKSLIEKNLDNCALGIMNSAVKAIEAKDIYIRGHSARVALYTELIAQKLAIPKEKIAQIRNAALLHDIGKMGVREEILNKPDYLNEEERTEILKHPEIGAQILDPIPIMKETIMAVRHHHERYDGSGYPGGLKGKEIPLWARIIAVADAYDAMTSDRSYRKAMGVEEALKEIKKHKGTQFDPQVVNAFLSINPNILKKLLVGGYHAKVS